MNHVLLSSWEVFSSAPIHDTRPPISPPVNGDAADDAEAEQEPREPAALDPDDVGPVHDEDVIGDGQPDAAIAMMAPAPAVIALPMKSFVTVALDMSWFPFGVGREWER